MVVLCVKTEDKLTIYEATSLLLRRKNVLVCSLPSVVVPSPVLGPGLSACLSLDISNAGGAHCTILLSQSTSLFVLLRSFML